MGGRETAHHSVCHRAPGRHNRSDTTSPPHHLLVAYAHQQCFNKTSCMISQGFSAACECRAGEVAPGVSSCRLPGSQAVVAGRRWHSWPVCPFRQGGPLSQSICKPGQRRLAEAAAGSSIQEDGPHSCRCQPPYHQPILHARPHLQLLNYRYILMLSETTCTTTWQSCYE